MYSHSIIHHSIDWFCMNPDPKSTRTMNQKAKGIEEENVWQTVEMRWKITECWNEMVSNGDLNKFKGKYIYICKFCNSLYQRL